MKNKKNFEYYIITILFVILIVTSFLQVIFRFVLNYPLGWTEEASRYIFIILIYLGASAAALGDNHVRVEVIDNFLPPKIKRYVDFCVRILCSICCVIMTFNLKGMIKNSIRSNQLSAALRIPISAMYIIVGILFLLIAFRFLQKSFEILKTKEGEKE